MEVVGRSTVAEESFASAVSWSAIAAGAVSACALTLILLAFGAGIGLASVSPWSNSGVSASTLTIGAGIYLIVVAVMSSAIGGYLAARLRTRWTSLDTNEVYFRDTAHGLVAWALATLLAASVMASAATSIVGGAAQAVGMAAPQAAAQSGGLSDMTVDRLLRPGDSATAAPAQGDAGATRAELGRLLASSFRDRGDLSAADRSYVARIVAARTGLSQADAERRVSEVIAEAKQALDTARKATMKFSLWLAASLLFGAFAASLAAVEGGQLRDGTWEGRRLIPRSL